MSWGTLDKGILTGRVDEEREGKKAYDKSDCRSWAPWWKEAANTSKFEAMKAIWPVLDKYHHNGLELALTYNLSFPELSVALCGAKNSQQLRTLFKALENPIKKPLMDELGMLAKAAQK